MTTKTWKRGTHNLTAVIIRCEIKRIEGKIRHPEADALIVSEQIDRLSNPRDEVARRMLAN